MDYVSNRIKWVLLNWVPSLRGWNVLSFNEASLSYQTSFIILRIYPDLRIYLYITSITTEHEMKFQILYITKIEKSLFFFSITAEFHPSNQPTHLKHLNNFYILI